MAKKAKQASRKDEEKPAPTKKRPAPSQASDDADAAFPRGGAETLTPLERRQIQEEARQALDREEEAAAGKQRNKRAKSSQAKGQPDNDGESVHFLGEDGSSHAKHKHVPLLSAKRLSVGTRLLAIVLEVTPAGLVLSLPHGLRGHVKPQEASDILAQMLDPESKAGAALRASLENEQVPALPDLFHVGQYVRCQVISTGASSNTETGGEAENGKTSGKKRIDCTLRLKKICAGRGSDSVVVGAALPAVVRSVEDHGYTLDFSIKGVKGFLSRTDHEAAHGEGATLLPGALLDVAIRTAPDARGIAKVSSDPTLIAGATANETDALGLTTLLPGTLMNAKVADVLHNGLTVKLLGVLTATVDGLHLGAGLSSTKAFKQDQKLKARVLYVDPVTKDIALSLLPHVLALSLPSPIPSLGQLFESAPVLRVDEGLGLLVSLPLGGELGGTCPAYCHVSNVSDEPIIKLSAKYKAGGSDLKCRVIGFRLVDGLASVSARTAALEQQVMGYRDLVPGQLIGGKVIKTDLEAGLLLELAPHVRALVPVMHMSDLGKESARKKFKVGQQVQGRVLNVEPDAKKLSMTLKPALLGSKLKPITSVLDAVEGMKSHGVVTGVLKNVVFVSFYGGVSGVVPRSELGLANATDEPSSMFSVGQAVRARVLSINHASGHMKLSLKSGASTNTSTPANTDPCGDLQPGDIITSGRVVRAEGLAEGLPTAEGSIPAVLVLEVSKNDGPAVQARLELPGHLADHPGAAAALLPLMSQPGTSIGPLVVLERLEGQKVVKVSRKPMLVSAAQAGRLPCTFNQVQEGMLAAGYVANVTPDAVFVRFGGHVTGRAGLSQLADTFVSDPHSLFSVGQTVRAQVVTVDESKQRFSVTLRPSITASTDASYIASLYSDLELAALLKASQSAGGELSAEDWSKLAPGSVVQTTVDSHSDFGLVVDIANFPDLVGVIRPHHYPSGSAVPKPDTPLTCRILDTSKLDNIVDVSAKPSLVPEGTGTATANGSAKKKSKTKEKPTEAADNSVGSVVDAKQGMVVEGLVELLKEDNAQHIAVISIPSLGNALAYVATTDFNSAVPQAVRRRVKLGDTVKATLQVLPSKETGGRLLAAVDLASAPPANKTDKKDSSYEKLVPGSVVTATVTSFSKSHADVTVGKKTTARLHITEIIDLPSVNDLQRKQKDGEIGNPMSNITVGQSLQVVLLPRGKQQKHAHGHHGTLDVSMRPSVLAAAALKSDIPAAPTFGSFSVGSQVVGVVSETADDHAWISICPHVRGRLHVLDASSNPAELPNFQQNFPVGKIVVVRVTSIDTANSTMDFTLLPESVSDTDASQTAKKKKKGTSSTHSFVPAAVIMHAASNTKDGKDAPAKTLQKILPEGSLVMAKVHSLGGPVGGVRLHLGGRLHGRVAMTDIHDTWVANALEGLTEGGYVQASVLSVDAPDQAGGLPRISLSLRASKGGSIPGIAAAKTPKAKRPASALSSTTETVGQACPELLETTSLEAGQVVRGYVKRSDAKSGVFVALDRTHDAYIKLRNLSDGFVEDPVAAFPAGMMVEGKLLSKSGGVADNKTPLKLEITLRSKEDKREGPQVSDFKEGQFVSGKVRRVEAFGVFVELEGSTVVGLAHISEVSDSKVKDIHALFRTQQAVRAKVIKVDVEKKKISLSMKPSVLEEDTQQEPELKKRKVARDFDEEMADADEDGNSEEDQEKEGSDMSEDEDGEQDNDMSEENDDDESQPNGNGVSIDDLDVSESDQEGSESDNDKDEDASGESDGEGQSDSDDDEEGQGNDAANEDEDNDDSDAMEGDSDDGDDDEDVGKQAALAGAQLRQRLAAASYQQQPTQAPDEFGGLLVIEDTQPKSGVSSDGQEGGKSDKKASKAARKREAEEAERKIREAELARLRGETAPQSTAEFERSVLSSPNSSYTWIRYMAWLLGLGETDKARAVAQRALDAIHYREEGEKFNVWVAWLNLEAVYGTPVPADALMTLFNKAVQYCDQKKLYFALLGILQRHNLTKLEGQTIKAMCKKFNGSAKVWLKAIELSLTQHAGAEGSAGDGDAARKSLERALQALPQRKHIKVITGAALLEFRQGNVERGRGVMEGVLRNYPKRLDLWSLYIDQEVKLGDEQRTRALFERATSLSLPARKMKFLFKRWLEWEKRLSGGASTPAVEHVKQRAMEFVQAAAKA